MNQAWVATLAVGLPLLDPPAHLAWGQPLAEVAGSSGGIWRGDRYHWNDISCLDGLRGSLSSQLSSNPAEPLRELWMPLGLTSQGLWSDATSLEAVAHAATHLANVFGERGAFVGENDAGGDDLIWRLGPVNVRLILVEQHVYRGHLIVQR